MAIIFSSCAKKSKDDKIIPETIPVEQTSPEASGAPTLTQTKNNEIKKQIKEATSIVEPKMTI